MIAVNSEEKDKEKCDQRKVYRGLQVYFLNN